MKLHGNQCECTACGERFGVESTFSAHRVGEHGQRRCLSIEEMDAKGWFKNERGLWKRSQMPSDYARRERRNAA